MELMHATIYGFGKWHDYSIDFSKSPLLCIYGENESGKSTLQQFILFMLFGLPPKKRAFFKPKTSGKMGGRLTIFDGNIGEFTIDRVDDSRNGAARCYTPDGLEYDEDWLKERLNGMTHKTYQSIFSFSALDLSVLQNMNEDDLGEVLLGIGLTGSKNIYSIEKRIDTKIGELFKPYGKKPTINKQLDSLDELFQTMTKYRNGEATYREKKDKVRSLSSDMQNIKTKLNEEKEKLSSIEKQQQALPLIQGYRNYSNQMESYPAEITFPEDGLNRLQALKEKILPMQSELTVLLENQKKYKEKQANLKEELYDENIYDEVQNILQTAQLYTDDEKEINKLKDDLKKLEIQIDNELSKLNIGISIDDLTAIALPFYIENSWNQLKNDYEQLQLEKEQLQQDESLLTNQRDYLINQLQELKTDILPEPRVSELNETINEYKQQTSMKKIKEDSLKQHKKWQQIKEQKDRMGTNVLIGSIILALICGALAFLRDSTILYSFMAILVLVGIVLWGTGKRSLTNMGQLLLSDHMDELGNNHITREVYDEAEHLLALHNKKKNDLNAFQEQLKVNDSKLFQLDERNSILSHKEKRFSQKMDDQYTDYPFLRNVDLLFWPQFYHTMKQIVQKNESKLEVQKKITKLEGNQSQFENEVKMFFDNQNWESTNNTIPEQLKVMEELIEHYRKTLALIKQYDNWISEAIEQHQTLKQRLSVYEKETIALYNVASVNTEEDFFQKAKKWNEKRNLDEKLHELTDQLLAIFRKAEWGMLANSNIDEHQLEIQHEELVATIRNLETELENKRQELADVNADLAQMETSEIYSETLHRYNMEQENLHQLAREWAVLKTAKEMLIETKRKFRDKYLTKVMDKTAYYFSVLTNHNYKSVFAPTEDQVFQVLGADDLKYTVKELSQGTTDQLYVALRVAISEVMSEKHRLPFIIDDAFVHFDTSRTKQVMKILSEIAEKQQVILFACKKDVVATENKEKIVLLKNTVRIN